MKNPFVPNGKPVSGEHFIGRRNEIADILEKISRGDSVFLVGLPRMGKSSILNYFETNSEYMKEQFALLPVSICVSSYNSVVNCWIAMADKIKFVLRKLYKDQKRKKKDVATIESIESVINYFEDNIKVNERPDDETCWDQLHTALCNYLHEIQNELNYRVLFLLDEFDKIKEFPNTSKTKIKEICSICPIITASRRHIDPPLADLQYKPIFVGMFSKEDIKLYWDHYVPLMQQIQPRLKDKALNDYKMMVQQYVGSHPYLMAILGEEAFKQPAQIANGSKEQQDELKRNLRITMRYHLMEQLRILDEQNLRETAIRLVLGGKEDYDTENAQQLKDFTFLQTVPSRDKVNLFGREVGSTYFVKGEELAYVCFSNYFTSLMYKELKPKLRFEEKLETVELLLRDLVERYIINIICPFDLNWKKGRKISLPNQKIVWVEKWESYMDDRLKELLIEHVINENQYQQWYEDMTKIKNCRQNQLQFENNIQNDPANRSLIHFTTFGNLWYMFMKIDGEWFRGALGLSPQSWRKWFSTTLKPIIDIRNAQDHYNLKNVPESKQRHIEEKCDLLCESVRAALDRF